jgi:hypothetical protein
MHQETEALRKEWNNLLQTTTLERLLATSDSNFIRSIATT